MTKVNYSAWLIDARDFSDAWTDISKLLFFAKYAILAPSGHNSQPWRFSSNGESMLLKVDSGQKLPYSGIRANEPWVSLGSCLAILRLAAKGFGYNVSVDYVLTGDLVAAIKLAGKVSSDSSLLQAITHRVSNRNYYITESLPETLIENLARSESDKASAYIISERKDIAFVADLTAKATLSTFADTDFRTELSEWVRNNRTKKHDGMPGFVQGIPTPMSMFAKHVIKRFNVAKGQAKKDSTRILRSGNLIIITVRDLSHISLVKGGEMYARICVLAQQKGIATAGSGAATFDPATNKELHKRFNLPGQPIAIIRLGKTRRSQNIHHAGHYQW